MSFSINFFKAAFSKIRMCLCDASNLHLNYNKIIMRNEVTRFLSLLYNLLLKT